MVSKLEGAKLAQADFGIFWVFVVYVIPINYISTFICIPSFKI